MVSSSKDGNSYPETGVGQGQIVTPNPIELFWEKNRKLLLSILLLMGLYFIGYYGVKFYRRSVRNKTWATVAQKENLRTQYLPPKKPSLSSFGFSYKFSLGLKPGLSSSQIGELVNGSPALWAYWFSAEGFCFVGDLKEVSANLGFLAKGSAPIFFLQENVGWPLINFNQEEELNKENRKEDDTKLKVVKPRETLLAMSKKIASFRQTHPSLFSAPKGEKGPVVLFQTSIGDFRVKVFQEIEPAFASNFLKKVRRGFYDGLRFHQIQHSPPVDPRFGFSLPSGGDMVWLGNPTTRSENKKDWDLNYKSSETIPFEESKLSHYPFVIAAKREKDALNCSSEIVYFTTTDCSKELDGSDVVFGVVIDGKDVIKEIVNGELSSPAEVSSGKGLPKKPIKVLKATVSK